MAKRRRSGGTSARSMVKRPTSWVGVIAWAAGISILAKAFWPSADNKLSGIAADVKKIVDKNGGTA